MWFAMVSEKVDFFNFICSGLCVARIDLKGFIKPFAYIPSLTRF